MNILKKLTLLIGIILISAVFLHAEEAKEAESAETTPKETSCTLVEESSREDSGKSSAQIMAEKTEAPCKAKLANPRYGENVIDVAVESWHLFSVDHTHNYYVAPQIISVIWQLDEVGLDGWLRGNTAWTFSGFYSPVVDGPENRMIGTCWGPRYNFVQEGWDLVPYVESRVGILFIDSGTVNDAQGQDFCFQFMVSVGTRWDFEEDWSLQISANYQHVSNSGLSEPERKNVGLDTIGPGVSLIHTF